MGWNHGPKRDKSYPRSVQVVGVAPKVAQPSSLTGKETNQDAKADKYDPV